MTVNQYWDIVNSIPALNDSMDIRSKCNSVEKMLKSDDTLSNDDFDELMMAISFIYRTNKT